MSAFDSEWIISATPQQVMTIGFWLGRQRNSTQDDIQIRELGGGRHEVKGGIFIEQAFRLAGVGFVPKP